MVRVFIKKIEDKKIIDNELYDALNWINLTKIIRPATSVFIKPNFTFPFYKEGVTTSPIIIEALVKVLKEQTQNIVICESDGGYNSWSAEDAFRGHNIDKIEKKYCIKHLNLSKIEKTNLPVFSKGKKYQISIPKLLMEEVEIFITMPVPKVHCMTGVSLAMKNQWGCIPDTMRLSFHHIFSEAILEINNNLPKAFVVADGQFFLDKNGPMYGIPKRKDLLIASNDIGSCDMVLCELMKVNIQEIKHLKFAQDKNFIPKSLQKIEIKGKLTEYKYNSSLNRSFRNKIMYRCFNSKFLTNIFYMSGFGKTLHKLYYKIRKTPEHLKILKKNYENLTHRTSI